MTKNGLSVIMVENLLPLSHLILLPEKELNYWLQKSIDYCYLLLNQRLLLSLGYKTPNYAHQNAA